MTKDKMWTKGTLKGDGISTPRPRRSSAAVPTVVLGRASLDFDVWKFSIHIYLRTYIQTDRQAE